MFSRPCLVKLRLKFYLNELHTKSRPLSFLADILITLFAKQVKYKTCDIVLAQTITNLFDCWANTVIHCSLKSEVDRHLNACPL